MFLTLPFAFAQELDARGINEQMQPYLARTIPHMDLQTALTTADGAEVGYRPIQPRQIQKGFNKAHRLTQRQTEQILDGQAKLDGRIGELRAALAFAASSGKPLHVLVEQDSQ